MRILSWTALALCSAIILAEEIPQPTLAELVKSGVSTPQQQAALEEAYLRLQLDRLTGAAPLPVAKGRTMSKLTDDEIAKLKVWFDSSPTVRRKLLLALSPGEDDFAAASRVVLSLREKYPRECETLENLVVAFATTWDDEKTLKENHVHGIPELWNAGYTGAPLLDSFGWFAKNQSRLCPWFKNTPHQLLKFLANEFTAIEERDWLSKTYPAFRNNIGVVYSDIVYDHAKLQDGKGKLADKPYTLTNLKQLGGVCRDQAYYARAACRSMGMPAYYASGSANSGGRHAWVGWIVYEQNSFKLVSHGRYEYDKYFTAQITDPKSGERVLDYLVAIEAKALSNEKGFETAEFCYRAWSEVSKDESIPVDAKNALLIAALKKNPYHRAAWLAIGDATVRGELPLESAGKQWEFLTKTFTEFPDFIYSMAVKFSAMHKAAKEKYGFFESNSKMFVLLKRQDLVAKLRIDQIDMCEKEDRKDLAAQVAITGMQECAGEGERGVLLAKKAVQLLRDHKQLPLAVKPLNVATKGMMKIRAGNINPNWLELMELLRGVHSDLGEAKQADGVQQEIDRTLKTAATKR